MKKNLIIYSVVFMLLATFLPATVMAEGAELRIVAPSELPGKGETFEVTAEISGNPGISAIGFALAYDEDKMECTEVVAGEVLDAMMTVTNPSKSSGAYVTGVSVDAIAGDGVIAHYTFVAKADITQFDFIIDEVVLCDADAKSIVYTVTGAEIAEKPQPTATPTPTAKPTQKPSSGATGSKPSKPDTEEVVEPEDVEPEVFESYFPDVIGHWGEKFILSAADKGLFNGDDNGNFNPDSNITRAQFVTVLWRMAGSPAVDEQAPFTDIANQIDEFKSAIAWGYSNGYINGTSETTFDPDGTLTREAGTKILHYYSGGKVGNETMVYMIYDGALQDSKSISDWAKPSVYWAIYNKIISGTSETTISPKDTTTRAQLAKILVNYIDSYENQ